MKNTTLVSLTAFIFYLFLSFFTLVSAAGLVLQIKASKANYVIAEPVVLYVSIENTSNEAIELPVLDLRPMYDEAEYKIRRLEDNNNSPIPPFRPFGRAHRIFIDPPYEELAPGLFLTAEVKLFLGAWGWTFAKPGTYEVKAYARGGLVSNTITIRIPAPTDEQTAQAAKLFLESPHELGLLLLWEGGDHLTDGIRRLEQVASQYPDTPHATYANLVLGTRLIDKFSNFVENRLRPEDPAGAIPFLEKAKQNPVGFYDILHTHMSLYRAHTKLNNTKEAESALKDLVQMVSTQFEGFLPFLEYILEKKGIPMPEIAQMACLLYAVHDKGQKASRFFTVNLAEEDFEIKPLGLKLQGHDISLTAADFDGDGEDEMALAAKPGGHTVTLYELDGTEIRSFPVSASGISLAAGDLNGNGRPEIIVASRASNRNRVFVYDAEGAAVDSIAMFDQNTRMSPAVGDIDGDQRVDMIAGQLLKGDQVAVYNSASQARHHFSVFQDRAQPRKKPHNSAKDNEVTYGVQVASDDFDEDGKAEIVAAMASKGSQVEVYSSEGTLINAFTAFDSQDGVVLTVGNVVNDGQPEIIVGEAKGTRIRGFNLEGEQLFEFQAVAQGSVSSLTTFRCEKE